MLAVRWPNKSSFKRTSPQHKGAKPGTSYWHMPRTPRRYQDVTISGGVRPNVACWGLVGNIIYRDYTGNIFPHSRLSTSTVI